MENENCKKYLKIYGLLGKSLTGCAGGISGFLLGGPLLAILGVIVGVLGGYLLEKSVIKVS